MYADKYHFLWFAQSDESTNEKKYYKLSFELKIIEYYKGLNGREKVRGRILRSNENA